MSTVLENMRSITPQASAPETTSTSIQQDFGEFITEFGPAFLLIARHAILGFVFAGSAVVFAVWLGLTIYAAGEQLPIFSTTQLSIVSLVPLVLLDGALMVGGMLLFLSARWLWRTKVSVFQEGLFYEHDGESSWVRWQNVDSIIETVHHEKSIFPFLSRPVERNYLLVRSDGKFFDFNPVLIEDIDSWVDVLREAAIRYQLNWDVIEQRD